MLPLHYWFQFKKLRIILAWIGGAFLLWGSRVNEKSFKLGLPLILAGELVRIWSLGFLEKRGKILATAGPFAYVRNPLYLGNFLIGLGVILAANRLWLTGVFLVGFVILYRGTVAREEEDLLQKFGEAYRTYLSAVPCFVPRLTPHSSGSGISFRRERFLQYREHITWVGLVLFLLGLFLFEKVVRAKKFFWKEKWALALLLAGILYLICEWSFREWKKRFRVAKAVVC